MSINVIDTIKPKNIGFPVAEAIDIAVEGYPNLAEAVTHFATDDIIAAIDAVLSGKANAADVTTSVANLQGQIDQIEISASAESVVAPEVAAARVDEEGNSFDTLKKRLDSDYKESIHIRDDLTAATGAEFYGYIPNSYISVDNPTIIGEEDGWAYAAIDCEENDVFYVKGYGGNGPRLWFFLDSDNAVVSQSPAGWHLHDFAKVVAPDSAVKLICNSNNDNASGIVGSVFKGEKIRNDIHALYQNSSTVAKNSIDAVGFCHEEAETLMNGHSDICSDGNTYGFTAYGDFDAIVFRPTLYKSGAEYTGNEIFTLKRYKSDTSPITNASLAELVETYVFHTNVDNIILNVKKNEFFIFELPAGVYLGYSWNNTDTAKNIIQIRFDNDSITTFNNFIEGAFKLYNHMLDKENVLSPVELSWIEDKFYNWDSGAFAENANVMYTSLSCHAGEKYEVSGYSFYGARLIIFRDIKGKKLSSFPNTSNSIRWDKAVIEVPAGATEMIVQSRSYNPTDQSSNYKNAYVTKVFKSSQVTKHRHTNNNVKWVAIGDSLTAPTTLNPLPNYVNYVSEVLGIEFVNMGISGTGYINNNSGANTTFVTRVGEIPTDADIVTVFGSFNDVYVPYTLGTINDTSADNTFYGKLKKFIEDVSDRVPHATLGFITPTPWGSVNPVTGGTTYETIGKQYVKAILEVAEMYSIPVLDLFHSSNMRMYDATFVENYGRYGTDSTHPNSDAHRKFIAPKTAEFIGKLIAAKE